MHDFAMLEANNQDYEVIRKDAWGSMQVKDGYGPGPKQQGQVHHSEGATLRYVTPSLICQVQAPMYTIMDKKMLHILNLGVKHTLRHACQPSYAITDRPNYHVETLSYIG